METGIDLKVDILDVLGNNVKTLFEGKSETNELNLVWSSDNDNNKIPSGIYLLRIRAGSAVITEKLILSR